MKKITPGEAEEYEAFKDYYAGAPKFADKRLRKAMGYAIDNQSVGDNFYKGLRSSATSVIPPSQPKYHDKTIEGYKFDMTKAKYRIEVYKKWQRLVSEEAPLIPTLFRYGLTAINNRIQNWDLTPGKLHLNEITLTSDKAIQNDNK